MPLTEETFLRIAREDADRRWELRDGELLEKPALAFDHNDAMTKLGHFLLGQLDWNVYTVHVNSGHLKRTGKNYFVPDVAVIPLALARPFIGRADLLEVYEHPLPLVAEVWSPLTGDHDVDTKIPEYQARGDLEIWRLHPYDRTLTAWRRQPDGSYAEHVFNEGTIKPQFLPNVEIKLAALFI